MFDQDKRTTAIRLSKSRCGVLIRLSVPKLDRGFHGRIGRDLRGMYAQLLREPIPNRILILWSVSVAISLTRNTDYADDLVQDAILRAWRNIEKFQPGTSMNAWLFTILRNSFLSQYRYNRRHVEDPDGSYAGHLWTPPEQNGKCDVQDMLKALAKLPVDQREALILVAAEGMSYEDAAQVCGVAIGTVKTRAHRARARARLAELLAFHDAEDFGPDRVTQAALQSAV